ncbi:MAG: T9SS type A sorting domain-containing protein [Bacteroidia bacterium]|nr:T9SS type A sorting domain-containing protein [Bacteroidia bacterium]
MKKLLLAGTFLMAAMSGFAQVRNHQCGTDEHLHQMMQSNPELQLEKIKFESNMREAMKNYHPANYRTEAGLKKKAGPKYIIPVVVHVFHNNGNENISDAQINNEIAFLNRTFRNLDPDSTFRRAGEFITPAGDTNYYDFKSLAADAEIEFRLAKKDPQGNCTNGIVRVFTPLTNKGNDELKKTSVWDTKKYFNMWVVRTINRGNTIGIAGYAQFPFGPGGGASTDGIMVMSQYFGTNDETVTHEVGHWLGLYHPFQISSDSCGLDGDGVMDTPPTYFNPTTTEPLRNRCNNKSFNTCSTDKPDLPDMQENYMDYFTGSCASNMFTLEQKARMHTVLNNIRIPLWSAENLAATGVDGSVTTPCPPVAAFNSQGRTICAGNRAQLIDFSYGGTITSYEWTFEGGEPATFTGKTPPQILYNTPGQYDVTLKVTGPNGTRTTTLEDYINVIPASSQLPAGYYTADWWYQNNYEEQGWTFEYENPFNKFRRYGVSYNQNVSMLYPRDPFNINRSVGTLSSLISPAFDFSGQSNAYFRFNYAFAQGTLSSNLGGGNTKDELRVYTSVDCGRTWISRVTYSDGGTNGISTIGTGTAGTLANNIDFVPADQSKWKTVTISGGQIPNSNNVRFKIEFRYQGGNNFYLDNVHTGLTTGLSNENLAESIGFKVQPNPFTVNTHLHYDLRDAANVSIEVMDILGKSVGTVFQGTQQAGTQEVEISKNSLQLKSGIYLVQVKIGESSFTQKIIVE